MALPTYMRNIVRGVLAHADKIGDGHAGWSAIHDYWDQQDIGETLARERVRDVATGIKTMQRVADEIITNAAR